MKNVAMHVFLSDYIKRWQSLWTVTKAFSSVPWLYYSLLLSFLYNSFQSLEKNAESLIQLFYNLIFFLTWNTKLHTLFNMVSWGKKHFLFLTCQMEVKWPLYLENIKYLSSPEWMGGVNVSSSAGYHTVEQELDVQGCWVTTLPPFTFLPHSGVFGT